MQPQGYYQPPVGYNAPQHHNAPPSYPAPPGAYPAPQPTYAQPAYQQSGGYNQGYANQPYSPNHGTDPDILAAREIMNNGLCGCLSDPCNCLLAWCFRPCVFGNNFSRSEQGPCIIGCCCSFWLCGLARGGIQRFVGVADDGCVLNCLTHICCPLCAVTQESRALDAYLKGVNRARAMIAARGPVVM